MSNHDLPPELRRRSRPEAMPIELPLQLPLDDAPPLPNPDRASVDQQRNPEPYLRQS
ncbi:MAG: hypothetical protein WB973_02020 [Thermoanaerobaculia bacterium]